MKRIFVNRYGQLHGGWVILFVVSGVIAFCIALMVPIRAYALHIDTARCNAWGPKNERETRFVVYNYWNWDCITPTGDGRWLPIDQLRDEV